jgi:hypothetical protein
MQTDSFRNPFLLLFCKISFCSFHFVPVLRSLLTPIFLSIMQFVMKIKQMLINLHIKYRIQLSMPLRPTAPFSIKLEKQKWQDLNLQFNSIIGWHRPYPGLPIDWNIFTNLHYQSCTQLAFCLTFYFNNYLLILQFEMVITFKVEDIWSENAMGVSSAVYINDRHLVAYRINKFMRRKKIHTVFLWFFDVCHPFSIFSLQNVCFHIKYPYKKLFKYCTLGDTRIYELTSSRWCDISD